MRILQRKRLKRGWFYIGRCYGALVIVTTRKRRTHHAWELLLSNFLRRQFLFLRLRRLILEFFISSAFLLTFLTLNFVLTCIPDLVIIFIIEVISMFFYSSTCSKWNIILAYCLHNHNFVSIDWNFVVLMCLNSAVEIDALLVLINQGEGRKVFIIEQTLLPIEFHLFFLVRLVFILPILSFGKWLYHLLQLQPLISYFKLLQRRQLPY